MQLRRQGSPQVPFLGSRQLQAARLRGGGPPPPLPWQQPSPVVAQHALAALGSAGRLAEVAVVVDLETAACTGAPSQERWALGPAADKNCTACSEHGAGVFRGCHAWLPCRRIARGVLLTRHAVQLPASRTAPDAPPIGDPGCVCLAGGVQHAAHGARAAAAPHLRLLLLHR